MSNNNEQYIDLYGMQPFWTVQDNTTMLRIKKGDTIGGKTYEDLKEAVDFIFSKPTTTFIKIRGGNNEKDTTKPVIVINNPNIESADEPEYQEEIVLGGAINNNKIPGGPTFIMPDSKNQGHRLKVEHLESPAQVEERLQKQFQTQFETALAGLNASVDKKMQDLAIQQEWDKLNKYAEQLQEWQEELEEKEAELADKTEGVHATVGGILGGVTEFFKGKFEDEFDLDLGKGALKGKKNKDEEEDEEEGEDAAEGEKKPKERKMRFTVNNADNGNPTPDKKPEEKPQAKEELTPDQKSDAEVLAIVLSKMKPEEAAKLTKIIRKVSDDNSLIDDLDGAISAAEFMAEKGEQDNEKEEN